MKFILLFFIPILAIAQTANEKKIYLLGKKVELTTPAELTEMSDPMYKLKYENRPRPAIALSDKRGEVSLLGTITHQRATEAQIPAYKDFQISELKKRYPDFTLINEGVKTIRGKKVGYFKFSSQAVDHKIFNLYFFTVVDGEVILFSFNCIEKLRVNWENKSEKMLSSLIVR